MEDPAGGRRNCSYIARPQNYLNISLNEASASVGELLENPSSTSRGRGSGGGLRLFVQLFVRQMSKNTLEPKKLQMSGHNLLPVSAPTTPAPAPPPGSIPPVCHMLLPTHVCPVWQEGGMEGAEGGDRERGSPPLRESLPSLPLLSWGAEPACQPTSQTAVCLS